MPISSGTCCHETNWIAQWCGADPGKWTKGLEVTAMKHKQGIKHLRTEKSIPGKKYGKKSCNSFVWRIYKGKHGEGVNTGKDKLHIQVQILTKYSGKRYMWALRSHQKNTWMRRIGTACLLTVFLRLTNSKMIQEYIQTQPEILQNY